MKVVVNFAQPVVSRDLSAVVKDKASDAVCYGRIFLDSPVFVADVAVDGLFVVEDRGLHFAEFFALFSVKDVSLCYRGVAAFFKSVLNAVLNVFDLDYVVVDLALEIRRYSERQNIQDIVIKKHISSNECLFDSFLDFGKVEIRKRAVSFSDFEHLFFSSGLKVIKHKKPGSIAQEIVVVNEKMHNILRFFVNT